MRGLLADRVALVTGSARGIGRATALAMAEAGADVVVHYRRHRAEAEAVADTIRSRGRQALLVEADLEQESEVHRLFNRVQDAFGHLDILVANAAATAFRPLAELKPHHLERTYRLVVFSLVWAVQRAAPLMEGRQGRIITVSGHGSHFTLPLYATIGSAKSAVESLTRYLAYELGPRRITCNCIAPGVVDTDSARYYTAERWPSFAEAVARHTPLGRVATPEDVARVAVFLASDLAGFVTGQVIAVDGGLTLTSAPFEALPPPRPGSGTVPSSADRERRESPADPLPPAAQGWTKS
ncbi:MAG: SDR family oxidoreductase [Firmicutes bacterium]|nr:SDR family oxidoreductase [Alicyclobacillaceae bacterium]MCL6497461.1 SDR family oxidoreductase [Bacillota bacterium]